MKIRMVAVLMVLSLASVVVGCAPSTEKRPDGQAAASQQAKGNATVRYRMENAEIRAIPVKPEGAKEPRYELLVTDQRLWVIREYEKIDFGSLPLTAGSEIAFQPLDQVVPGATPSRERGYYWYSSGSRLFVEESVSNWRKKEPDRRLIQLYPERQERPLDATEWFREVTADGQAIYAITGKETIGVLDEALNIKEQIKVSLDPDSPRISRLVPIGDNQMYIDGALFDLKAKDFYWDESGAKKRRLSLEPGWRGMAVDPNGVIWVADQTSGDRRLHLMALTRDDKILFSKAVAPHQLSSAGMSPIVMVPTKTALYVAAIGMHQGEEKLLVYTFPTK